MRTRELCLAILLALVLTTGISRAFITFEPVTWDSGTEGWTSLYDVGTVANTGSGTLGFSFGVADPMFLQSDAVVADGLPGFVGNYAKYPFLSVTFDWFGYETSAQSLYFQSDFNGGSTWGYDLDVVDGWRTYTVSFADSAGWSLLDGVAGFGDALKSVSLIGILVGHSGSETGYEYQLDNWTFNSAIPEPGSIAMMLAVLGSSVLTIRFRGSRKEPAAE